MLAPAAAYASAMSEQTTQPAAPATTDSTAAQVTADTGRMPGILLDIAGVVAGVVVAVIVYDVLSDGRLSRKLRRMFGGASSDDD